MIKTLKQKTYQRNKQNTIIKDTGWLQTATDMFYTLWNNTVWKCT